MTPPDPKPTAPPTVASLRIPVLPAHGAIVPATDEEISGWLCGGRDGGCEDWPECEYCRMVARIEADRAESDRLRARVAELEEMYGELQDWVGEQMTPPDVVEDALVQIVAKAEHFIPPYAYGDNEAACEFANLLEQIHSIARAALKPEPR